MRKNLRHLIVLASITAPAAFVAGATTVAAVATEACSANPQQIQAVTQAGAQELECVATAALNGGISDPAIIATMCGGLTITTIVSIVDILLAGSSGVPEAGVLADAARTAAALSPRLFNFTPSERSTLTTLRNRAAALVASGSAK